MEKIKTERKKIENQRHNYSEIVYDSLYLKLAQTIHRFVGPLKCFMFPNKMLNKMEKKEHRKIKDINYKAMDSLVEMCIYCYHIQKPFKSEKKILKKNV